MISSHVYHLGAQGLIKFHEHSKAGEKPSKEEDSANQEERAAEDAVNKFSKRGELEAIAKELRRVSPGFHRCPVPLGEVVGQTQETAMARNPRLFPWALVVAKHFERLGAQDQQG